MGRILILGRDNAFNHVVTSWLMEEGHDVKNKTYLMEGLEVLESFQPEVVILDATVYMPADFLSFFGLIKYAFLTLWRDLDAFFDGKLRFKREDPIHARRVKTDTLIKKYISCSARKVIITGDLLRNSFCFERVEELISLGAFDVFEKPIMENGRFPEEEQMKRKVTTMVSLAISSLNDALKLGKGFKREKIIGNSPAIITGHRRFVWVAPIYCGHALMI
jgi:hypothetical protein